MPLPSRLSSSNSVVGGSAFKNGSSDVDQSSFNGSKDGGMSHSITGKSLQSSQTFLSLNRSASRILDSRNALRKKKLNKHNFDQKNQLASKKSFAISDNSSDHGGGLKRQKTTLAFLNNFKPDKKRVFKTSFQHQQSQVFQSQKVEIDQMENYQIVQKIKGQLYYTKMQNSDLVYFNTLKPIFATELYDQKAKSAHVQTVQSNAAKLNQVIKQTTCDNCANKFKSYVAGMFTDQTYCQFCMNYVCANCIRKVSGPDASQRDAEEQPPKKMGFLSKLMARDDNNQQDSLLSSLFFPTTVCERCCKKVNQYNYISVDMRNPQLQLIKSSAAVQKATKSSNKKAKRTKAKDGAANKEAQAKAGDSTEPESQNETQAQSEEAEEAPMDFRELLKLRRQCHLLFERIPDRSFNDFLINLQAEWFKKANEYKKDQNKNNEDANDETQDTATPKDRWQDIKYKFEHLVIRENIVQFAEIRDLPYLQRKLKYLHGALYKYVKDKEASKFQEMYCFECAKPICTLFGKTDINLAKKCPYCHKYFHNVSPQEIDGQNTGQETEDLACLQAEYRKQKSCFEVHLCAGLFENQFARLKKLEEMQEYDVAYLSEGNSDSNIKNLAAHKDFTQSQAQFFVQGENLLSKQADLARKSHDITQKGLQLSNLKNKSPRKTPQNKTKWNNRMLFDDQKSDSVPSQLEDEH